ncbi:MAG: hypothetical protein KatS3mg010_1630 [Acidimicrobiia bacterium]|nr:MAG: hypothetical protein KatS3mg010_1630 [Acidimicrobiia bacterium]
MVARADTGADTAGDELAALEAYQRDVEEHLADVEERIRRVRDRATG